MASETEQPQRQEEDGLRLAVVDPEDLAVVSAHLQDAELSLGDMAYLPGAKRFALVMARFDWALAAGSRFQRREAGMHFECVLKAERAGFDPDDTRPQRLLAISFTPTDAPSGLVHLRFAGGGCIRLTVECLEAEMRDMGAGWAVDGRPPALLDSDAASV